MHYRKKCDPVDHTADLNTLWEIEEMLPMNSYERKNLRTWVYQGNDPESNPWHYMDKNGWPMDYLEAYRYHHGYTFTYRYKIIEE